MTAIDGLWLHQIWQIRKSYNPLLYRKVLKTHYRGVYSDKNKIIRTPPVVELGAVAISKLNIPGETLSQIAEIYDGE